MNWRWSLLKQAALDFDEDEFGNDAASKWLRQQQLQQQQAPAPTAVAPAPQAQPAAPMAPSAPQGQPQPGQPSEFEDWLTGLDNDLDKTKPQGQRSMNKERDQALSAKWEKQLAQIQQSAIDAFGPAFQYYDREHGIQGSETGVYKALFESGTTRGADWKKFLSRNPAKDQKGKPVQSGGYQLLPPELQAGPGQATINAINSDLENTPEGQMPKSLQAILNAVESQDPEVFQLFTEAGRAANSLQQGGGESLNKEVGENGTARYNLMADESLAANSKVLGKHMGEQEVLAMDRIAEAFTHSPQNVQFLESSFSEQLQRIGEAMKVNEKLRNTLKDPKNAIPIAVQNAFKGDSPDGDNLWIKFFLKHKELILPDADEHRIRSYLDEPPHGHQDQGLEILEQLAGAGDPRVQQFFAEPIGHALDELSLNIGVKRIESWKTVNRDLRRISWVAQQAALREMNNEKKHGGDYGSAGRRYLMIKHKSKVAYNALQQAMSGKAVPIRDDTDQNKVRYTMMSVGPAGKGQLVLKDKAGHLHEVTADQFEEISRVARTEDWMPGVLQDAKKLDPELLKRPAAEENALQQEYKAAANNHLQQAQQQGADTQADDFDRMKGWRGKLSEKLTQALTLIGATPEQLADTLSKQVGQTNSGPNIVKNPKEWLQNILSGNPARYSFKDMNQVAHALTSLAQQTGKQFPTPEMQAAGQRGKLAQPSDAFYSEPPEYDLYNHEDITKNISELLPQGFRAYGPTLLHRKREADWRGVPFYNPASLKLFMSMMRIHPNFIKNDPEKQWGKMLMELTQGDPVGLSVKEPGGYKNKGGKEVMVSRPMKGEEAEEHLRQDKSGRPIRDPNIYEKSPSLHRRFHTNEYEKGVDEQGNPTTYKHPKEPDLTNMADELNLPHPKDQVKTDPKGKKKVNKLYHILENPSQYSEDERASASKQLSDLRTQIEQMPPKERAKFRHWLYPYRHVYDDKGNVVKLPPRKSMVEIGRMLIAVRKINRLAAMQGRMTKFADTTSIYSLIELIADEALSV